MFGLVHIWFFYYRWFRVPFPVGISFPFPFANMIYPYVTDLFWTLWQSFVHIQASSNKYNWGKQGADLIFLQLYLNLFSPNCNNYIVTINHSSLKILQKNLFYAYCTSPEVCTHLHWSSQIFPKFINAICLQNFTGFWSPFFKRLISENFLQHSKSVNLKDNFS